MQKIPDLTEIPALGASLVKLMQDFTIQVIFKFTLNKIIFIYSHYCSLIFGHHLVQNFISLSLSLSFLEA